MSVVSAFTLGGQAAAASRTEAIHHLGGETQIPAEGSLALPVPCFPPPTAVLHCLPLCWGLFLMLNTFLLRAVFGYSLDYILVGI